MPGRRDAARGGADLSEPLDDRLVEIRDPHDPRVADYVDLRDVNLRRHLEAEHGLFLAEGEKVIHRALAAGFRPRSFLLAPRWLDGLADAIAATDATVPVYVVDEALAERITGFHVHRGALASLHREAGRTVASVLADARRVVVLQDVVDHTNVGAAFRSAAALGFDAVLVSARCADPLYRRAIKTSMGTVFSIPYARLPEASGADDLAFVRDAGLVTVAMTLADDAVDVRLAVEELGDRSLALLFGSEGPGLTEAWTRAADVRARIGMAAGVDSLNLAASVAVSCFAFSGPGTTLLA